MPAFTSNGPDIPEHLIQAHEDGKVVFFCGAGISYRSGLPGFEGLVDDIYKALGTKKMILKRKLMKSINLMQFFINLNDATLANVLQ